MRCGLFLIAATVSACALPQAPPQIAPSAVRITKSPRTATQSAAAALTLDGFEIVTSDVDGGVVVAKRTRDKDGNADFVTCMFKGSSIGATNMRTTVTVSLSVKQASADSAEAVIATRVVTDYPTLTGMMARAPNEHDCASSGLAEQHVAAAVK